MKNLTKNQEQIIESLVAEFTNINESFVKTSDNIFGHLCDDLANDKKCIKELEALDLLGKAKIVEQIHNDFDKYNGMFNELGIELKRRFSNDNIYDWELVTLRKDKYGEGYHVRDYQGYNPLKWCYYHKKESKYILGYRRDYVVSYYIKCYLEYNKEYKNIEEIFETPTFKDYLKRLINIA